MLTAYSHELIEEYREVLYTAPINRLHDFWKFFYSMQPKVAAGCLIDLEHGDLKLALDIAYHEYAIAPSERLRFLGWVIKHLKLAMS